MISPLITKYGSQARWVNYRIETRKGKKTKVPYDPKTGKMASSTDDSTWVTYDRAYTADDERVGIVFTPDALLLGIDIDHCIQGDKITHKQKQEIQALLAEADTYTELSPSQEGLHLYLALTAPLTLTSNKRAPYEAYTSGRYFTSTGIPFGILRDIRTVTPQEALELLAIIGYPWKKEIIVIDEVGDMSEKQWNALQTADVLKKMFASKNGDEIKALYNGDISQYNNDHSNADMALLSHLAFWTGRNHPQMEALWLASPLAKRDKTQKRADYRTRSIDNAIASCKEIYTQQKDKSATEVDDKMLDLLFVKGEKGKIYIQNTENMFRILNNHPDFKGTFRTDTFRGVSERRVNGVWRRLQDSDEVDIQTHISVLFSAFRKVGKLMIKDAIEKVCEVNKYDSATDYIKSLTWDKTPRLDTWLQTTYGATDDELHQKIGSNWLKGLVKRIIDPGCKFDYVLVLEGEQGIRKSTSFSVLAGPLGHVETTLTTDNKDFYMQFLGNAIVEFSEGESLSRTEVKRMKAMITVQNDKYRLPYGHYVTENPRRCVFAMTTNQTEYLKDETGNRRWLPVSVTKVADTEWLASNRDQLFAEAHYRLTVGKETVHEFPEKEMRDAQNDRRIQNPNSEQIVEWYFKLSPEVQAEGVTMHQAFVQALNGGFSVNKPITKLEESAVVDVFRSVLQLDKRRAMIGGLRAIRWYPSTATVELQAITQTF